MTMDQSASSDDIIALSQDELENVSGGGLIYNVGYYVGLAFSWEAYGWEQVR